MKAKILIAYLGSLRTRCTEVVGKAGAGENCVGGSVSAMRCDAMRERKKCICLSKYLNCDE